MRCWLGSACSVKFNIWNSLSLLSCASSKTCLVARRIWHRIE
jgi:hypothetical protein